MLLALIPVRRHIVRANDPQKRQPCGAARLRRTHAPKHLVGSSTVVRDHLGGKRHARRLMRASPAHRRAGSLEDLRTALPALRHDAAKSRALIRAGLTSPWCLGVLADPRPPHDMGGCDRRRAQLSSHGSSDRAAGSGAVASGKAHCSDMSRQRCSGLANRHSPRLVCGSPLSRASDSGRLRMSTNGNPNPGAPPNTH
jgi:hypothetical protein